MSPGFAPRRILSTMPAARLHMCGQFWPIRQQTPRFHVLPHAVHGRQSRTHRQDIDANSIDEQNWIGKDVDRLRTAPDRLKSGSNFPCSPDFEWNQFETKRAGRRANSVKLHGAEGIAGLEQDCQPAQTGHELAQDFEALPGSIGMLTRQSGNVSAWARQTFDDAGANRISRGCE